MRKITFGVALVAILSSMSQPVFAGAPGEDFPQLGVRILLNLTKILVNEKRLSGIEDAVKHSSDIKKLSIDAMNRAWSNVMLRNGKFQTELQNQKIKIESQPALNVCGAFTASISMEVNLCDAIDEAVKYKKDHDNIASALSSRATGENANGSGSSSAPTTESKELEIIKLMKEKRPDLVLAKSREDQAKMVSPALSPTDASLLITSEPQFSTISPADAKVVSDFIYLIAPPFDKDNLKYRRQDLNDAQMVELLQDIGYHSVASQSLFYVMEKRLPSGRSRGSYLNTLERYAGKIFGPGQDTVSTAMMTSKLATPSAIYRNIALMKSNKVKMSLDEFKQGLRKEANMATYLKSFMDKD